MPDRVVTRANSASGVKAGRSPAYPAFSLATAIEKAGELYAIQRNNAVSIDAAANSLGYQTANSGTAQRTIAALISFGLVSEEGSGQGRKVKVTDLARKVILLEPGDTDRESALREAALKPKIYSDMLEQWPESLPSDTEISKYLTFTKKFNEDAVKTVISSFRSTYETAKLGSRTGNDHNISTTEANEQDTAVSFGQKRHVSAGRIIQNKEITQNSIPNQDDLMRTLHIPITRGRVVILQTPISFNESDLEFITKYITLMKDAIITDAPIEAGLPRIKLGKAVWHAKDFDQHIIVTGYLGEVDGKQFVSTQGSGAGVPLDEVEFEE